jgi:hypothetical protein
MFVFILYTFQANKLCGILWFDPYFTSVSWKQIFQLVHKLPAMALLMILVKRLFIINNGMVCTIGKKKKGNNSQTNTT